MYVHKKNLYIADKLNSQFGWEGGRSPPPLWSLSNYLSIPDDNSTYNSMVTRSHVHKHMHKFAIEARHTSLQDMPLPVGNQDTSTTTSI